MTSSYTTNKQIEKPANGDYNNTWSTPVNNDWDIIDQSLGGQTALNVVSASGTVALTVSQYRSPIIIITGLLTANVTYQIPAGVGGFWYVYNNTTGAYTITFANAAGGSTLTLAQGYTTTVISDGTNIGRGDTAPGVGGTGTVTSVNVSGGSTGLTFSGGPITSSGTITAGGTLGAAFGGTGLTTPGTAGNILVSNGTNWVSQAPTTGAVSSVTGSGSGISVSPTTGAVIISNTGVTSATAGTGIGLSGSTGGITISNSGVTSLTSGGGLSLSSSTGGITITNSGVTSLTAGSGITLSGSTGSITISASGGGGGTVALNDGSVSSPSLYFTNQTGTGLYRATGTLAAAIGGTQSMFVTSAIAIYPYNVALGESAGTGIAGSANVAIGYATISANFSATGASCTAVGYQALRGVTGTVNTAVGNGAGFNITSGANNTCLGNQATASSASVSNEITLGNSSVTTLRCQVTTITSLSDARDKKDVTDLDAGLAFINALKPVRFTWDMRPTEGLDGEMVQGRKDDPDTGFIAQDLKAAQEQLGITIPGLVYEINPDKLEAGYGKLLPVLVKAIQELSAKVEKLEAQLAGA